MPELYNEQFLATVNTEAPSGAFAPPNKQPGPPLVDQIQKALGDDAEALEALDPRLEELQIQRGDEAEVSPVGVTLNTFLVSPQKGNCSTGVYISQDHLNDHLLFTSSHLLRHNEGEFSIHLPPSRQRHIPLQADLPFFRPKYHETYLRVRLSLYARVSSCREPP